MAASSPRCPGAGGIAARALFSALSERRARLMDASSTTPGTPRPSRLAALRVSGFGVLKRCG